MAETKGKERETIERMVRAQREYDEALREYRAIQSLPDPEKDSVFNRQRFRATWDRLHVSAEALSEAGEELRRLRFRQIHSR